MRDLGYLVWKDCLLLLREPSALFMALIMPLLIASLFGTINSDQRTATKLAVAVVDMDGSAESARFIASLKAREEIEAASVDIEKAREALRRGERLAYLVLQPGFGEALDRFPFGPNQARLVLVAAPKQQAVAGMIVSAAMSAAADRSAAGGAGVAVPKPLDVTFETFSADLRRPASGFEISVPQAALWSILASVAAMSTGLATERQQQTLLRLRVSPTSGWTIVAAKIVSCMLVLTLSLAVILAIGRVAFGMDIHSFGLLVLAVAAAGFAFAGLMLGLGSLGGGPGVVAGTSWSVMVLFAMLGGGMIPFFLMPPWLELLSNVSPGKWTILALEGAIWRDFDLAEIALPVGVLVAVGIAGMAVGARRLGRETGT
jgi:ABC-2 type transport system permease protein